MNIVFYKLPSIPEDVVVAAHPVIFEECEIALMFDEHDIRIEDRYKVTAFAGAIRVDEAEPMEEPSLIVNDRDNFTMVIPCDSPEHAIQQGQRMQRAIDRLNTMMDRE